MGLFGKPRVPAYDDAKAIQVGWVENHRRELEAVGSRAKWIDGKRTEPMAGTLHAGVDPRGNHGVRVVVNGIEIGWLSRTTYKELLPQLRKPMAASVILHIEGRTICARACPASRVGA